MPGGGLDGKVALVTGAARGLGRSHAVRLAEEGADIIAVDICSDIEQVPYPMATADDLDETAGRVKAAGRRVVTQRADVRDERALQAAVAHGIAALGPVGVVVANAGVAPYWPDARESAWHVALDVNVTGTFHTVEAAIPSMIEAGSGGSIVLIGSTAGANGIGGRSRGGLGYSASKHAVVGLMRSYANALAPDGIRVNVVHPGGTKTPLTESPSIRAFLEQDPWLGNRSGTALPVGVMEPLDISEAVAWLAGDRARYVTGIELLVDAGYTNKK